LIKKMLCWNRSWIDDCRKLRFQIKIKSRFVLLDEMANDHNRQRRKSGLHKHNDYL